MASYSVEYAKSNRATCKGCKVKIDKDTLRVGTTVPGPGDYDMTSWRHLACQKKPAALTSPTALVGFASLKSADQDLVRQWYGGNTAAVAADKRKSDAASAMASPVFSTPKKQKMSPSSGAAAMAAGASSPLPKSSASTAASVPTDAEEEIKAMDAARTTFACLTLPDLKSCLRANEQLVGGTKPELVDRCADRKVYGNVPRCPTCRIGRLKVVYPRAYGHGGQGTFTCPGGYDDDQYVRCAFRSQSVARPAWKVTEWESAAVASPSKPARNKSAGTSGAAATPMTGTKSAPPVPRVAMPGDDD